MVSTVRRLARIAVLTNNNDLSMKSEVHEEVAGAEQAGLLAKLNKARGGPERPISPS
jgi:hypothetical protein